MLPRGDQAIVARNDGVPKSDGEVQKWNPIPSDPDPGNLVA